MKKSILLPILFSIMVSYSYAQSLKFVYKGEVLADNVTVFYSEINNQYNMDPHIVVKNQSSEPVTATLTVTALQEPVGGFIGYCGWGFNNCIEVKYGNPVESSAIIQPNEEIDPQIKGMDVDEETVNIKAEYKLTYGTETTTVIVHFVNDLTSIDTVKDQSFITIIDSELSYAFSFDAKRQLNIYNITGNLISSYIIQGQTGQISLPSLSKGIYFYSLMEDGKNEEVKKFVQP